MANCCVCTRLTDILQTVRLGLQVLWTEIRWLAGPDRRYAGRLTPLRREQARLAAELARTATLADPRHEAIAADLSLLEHDLHLLEQERAAAFAAFHAPLREQLNGTL